MTVAARTLIALSLVAAGVVPVALRAGAPQEPDRHRTRDAWQRPADVLDALGARPGARVADIGSGSGYFTLRLAARVGSTGKVFAVDVDRATLDRLRERVQRDALTQVEPILGDGADPHLPDGLDAALIVDAYHEFREYEDMLRAVLRALVPGGRLVIIDGEGPEGRPRTEYHRLHRIPATIVQEEVVRLGFQFKERRPGFHDAEYGKQMYFLVFEKPPVRSSDARDTLFVSPAPPQRTAFGTGSL